ncbi:MAG: DUF6159 family protein [Dehalococcoidia bacterium]
MFANIGHTFSLIGQSWRVLMQDRKLILFPIMGGAALLAVIAVFAGVAATTGSLDRLDTAAGGGEAAATPADMVLSGLLLVASYFVVMFFNAALIATAMERLRGRPADIGYGLSKAASHIPAILGWAIIAATVGLILNAIRDRTDNFLGQIAVAIAGGVWAYMTFFVVPVLIVEGLGPVAAIKRSGALLKETWGNQVTANFSFTFIYLGAALVAFLPAALLFAVSPLLGIIVGVGLIALAMGTVQALEGIFKAALYDFATGSTPMGFEQTDMRSAYRAL